MADGKRFSFGPARLALLAFLAWEAFGACVYLTGSTPDYEMVRPFVLWFGVIGPAVIGSVGVGLILALRAFFRLSPK